MNKIIDFYSGFEGESEFQLISTLNDGHKYIIRIWDGYFADIMDKIEFGENGWTGLAYYYHLLDFDTWTSGEPWEIPNLIEALQQLEQLEHIVFQFQQTGKVLKSVCNLLGDAIEQQKCVLIAEE